ncbi:hypothetical protein LP419_35270 [Massilia sp. H-1]|nr:hypothetical protein LP419_35270 [Massilia sp. H-1]
MRDVVSGQLRGYEAVARNAEPGDDSPSLWRQLDHAASDDESVGLDRLCRMLHAINFFRQGEGGDADLYLSVHDRLLSANQRWLLSYVTDNYKRNGFRMALNLPSLASAAELLSQVQ